MPKTRSSTGSRIKEAIRIARVPVTEVARRMGVHRGTLYRWMRDEFVPSVPEINELATITGQHPTFFLPYDRPRPTLVVLRAGEEVYRIPIDGDTEIRFEQL